MLPTGTIIWPKKSHKSVRFEFGLEFTYYVLGTVTVWDILVQDLLAFSHTPYNLKSRGSTCLNNHLCAFFPPRPDFFKLTSVINKFSFKDVMEHVIRVPHKYHNFFLANLLPF